ncbi:MAG: hypothetical protein LQ348_006596, partial [Seirophora lacunosa]
MATKGFRDHRNQLNADCKTLKRLLNDAEESYGCGSPPSILFCDLRDELVFSLDTLSCLLEQITTFYNLWQLKTRPSRDRREANALVAETSRRNKLRIVYRNTVWREVRDSRHQIMAYARLIDSYHQRRNMPGRIDGILARIESLYSSIDAAGHAFVYPHQVSSNAQPFELLQSVAATKRKLRAISCFFRDFGHYRKLLAPYAHNFLKDAETVNVSLDQLEKHLIRPSKVVHRRTTTNKTDDPALQNGGKAIHDFRVGLPKLGFQNLTSASKPRVAAFHTSAATRRPPVTDDAALRNVQPLEEETDQVSRSNDASDAQAGSLIGYCIPEVRMRECLQAPRTARSAYWQYTLYEGPKAEKVKVHYCKSLETSERIAKRFLNERVIGFDIEWKAQATAKEGIRKNVAVIQLASEDRIAIFHLARFSKGDSIDQLVAPSLRQIMESASITKVGVSIKSDCTRVRKFLGINSCGLFELSHLYKLVKYATNDVKKINKMLVSLATQTEQHLLLPMYKDESVRSSDWSEELNYEQIYYAASDSYAGFQLYHSLNQKRLALIPPPPLPAHADLNLPIRLANGQT